MINEYKALAEKCEELKDNTDIQLRRAELNNILTMLLMEIKFMEAGEKPNDDTLSLLVETRNRIHYMMVNVNDCGRHNSFKEELQLCDDFDAIDDLTPEV